MERKAFGLTVGLIWIILLIIAVANLVSCNKEKQDHSISAGSFERRYQKIITN